MQDPQAPDASTPNALPLRPCASLGVATLLEMPLKDERRRRLATGPLPSQLGGVEQTVQEVVAEYELVVAEQGVAGMAFSLAAHLCACTIPIWKSGTSAQHAQWLERLTAGEWVGACAMSERSAGCDIHAICCQARRTTDGYVLDGQKAFVTNAPHAGLFLVYAKTSREAGPFGISVFGVPRTTPGLMVRPLPEKNGLAGADWGDVCLTGCCVPKTSRLGGEGAGAAIFHHSMQWERLVVSAIALGNMQRALDQCLTYARQRKQFGKSLGQHQAIAHRLVEMKLRLERSRALVYHAAGCFDKPAERDAFVSLAKLCVMEDAVASGLDTVQILGAQGLDPMVRGEQLLSDSLPMRLASGSSEIQRELVARHLDL